MFELFLLPFFQRALIIGLMLGAVMSVLGVFIVLRKLSFFSDAIAHSALTGIAVGLLLQIDPFLSALVFALLVAAAIAVVRTKSVLSLDTLLGVFFSAAVALGVILVQLTPGYQADLMSFLFGDILTVSGIDVWITLSVAIVSALTLLLAGKSFISIAFNSDLAKVEGTAVNRYELIFLLLLAGVIALAIKLAGVILVSALLIIPAATAYNVSYSLISMFVGSFLVSVTSVSVGMMLSAALNTASGPTIVLTATVFFVVSLFFLPLTSKKRNSN